MGLFLDPGVSWMEAVALVVAGIRDPLRSQSFRSFLGVGLASWVEADALVEAVAHEISEPLGVFHAYLAESCLQAVALDEAVVHNVVGLYPCFSSSFLLPACPYLLES